MKKLKYLLYILIAIALIGFIAIKVMSENLPQGQTGPDADFLAKKVLKTLNKDAFDTIPFLQWEFFRAGQKYLWDKHNNIARIEWDNNIVIMELNTQSAKCYTDNKLQAGDQHEALKAKAWSNWCNDSFWLIAPYKLFDSGITRKVVKTENGKEALLITYSSGGATPGDSYLWELDENYRPTGYKMWTSIIPLKGMYSAWSHWEEHNGAILSTGHSLLGKEVRMKGVKAGDRWQDFGFNSNPFVI